MNANAMSELQEIVMVAEDPDGDEGTELLQSFCRAEMLAVEAYGCALPEASASVRDVLEDCQLSHAHRVSALKQRLQERGASVPETSGPWGALMQLVEVTAAKLSEKVALDVLRSWENQKLADYEADHDELTEDDQRFVSHHLRPRQEETKQTMTLLTQVVSGGS